jgi:hypothetical protein
MEKPKAAERHADADRCGQRERELHDKLPVFHAHFLPEAFNLDGHEVDP